VTKPIVFAHRGASLLAPENTLAAFELAYELGASAIELDVQLTADFVPVVIHDETLQRTTNGQGLVAMKTAAALDKLSAGAWFDPRFAKESVPCLKEVLSTLAPLEMLINIEIKPNQLSVQRLVDAVLDVLTAQAYPLAHILLSSFDRAVVKQLAAHTANGMPDYALLIDAYEPDAIFFAQTHGCMSINPNRAVLKEQGADFIKQAHTAGLKVYSFTVNDAVEAQAWLAAGLDGFFTDNQALYPLSLQAPGKIACGNP